MTNAQLTVVSGNRMVTFAAFVVIIAGIKAATPVVVPFLIALFVTIIASPFLFWLKDRGLPDWLSLILVIVGLTFVGFLLTTLIGSSLSDFSQALPQYQEKLRAIYNKLISWGSGYGIDLTASEVRDIFDPGAVMRFANDIFSSFKGVLSNLFLIFIATVMMLLEASSIKVKIRAAMNEPEQYLSSAGEFVESVKSYMVIKTAISFVTGLAVAIFLAIIGLDFAILWGLLAFILNYVPNIGWVISAVPAILLALIAFGPVTAVVVIAGYSVINFVLGNVVEPKVMGKGVGLSTLVVFASLVFWGWVMGPVGMILSVPLTMMAKIALQTNEETRWLAVLLGPEDESALSTPKENDQSKAKAQSND